MSSYTDILKQIEELKSEAERLRREEIAGVIERIKDAIAAYGLTAADLGFGAKRSAAAPRKTRAPRRAVRKSAAKSAPKARFADGTGNTWGGRGPRPRWLRDALASGKKLDDFKV